MPQPAVARPFGEFDLADQLRLHPGDAAPLGAGRRILERRLVDAALFQFGRQLLQRLRRETRADAAGVHEIAFVVITQAARRRSRRASLRASSSRR